MQHKLIGVLHNKNMMNHKQRVMAAIDGQPVDRFPMWYGADPETTAMVAEYLGVSNDEESVLQALDIDFRTVRPVYTGPELKLHPDGSRDSIWGIRRGGTYYGQALNHPLEAAQSIEDIESYPWPGVADWDVKSVRRQAEEYSKEYAVMGGAWSPFFHDVAELFGMENMFIQMAESPEMVEAAVEKCMEFYLELSRMMFEEMADEIDIFFFGNDFGAQTGLLCSPAMWRKFFGPSVKAMIELGHKYGLKTALHSCGSIREVIPDLIAMGLDIINPIQNTAAGMDTEELQKEFGKDIVFFGGIDVQHILCDGTPDRVRQEVIRQSDILGRDGRYILAPAHDYLLPDIPAENIAAMYQAGVELAR